MQLAFAGGPTVSIKGCKARNQTWVREFFASALTTTSPSPPSWRIVVVHSTAECDRLLATRTSAARTLPLYAVEREMLEAEGWEHDGKLLLDCDPHGLLLLDDRCITLTQEPDPIRPRFMLALILYELVATEMRRTWLELHAASIVVDGRAHLVIGPKGAGKTTLAMALTRAGGGLLGNDRAFARPDGVVGMPTPVKLLPDAEVTFSELVSEPVPPDGFNLTVDEIAAARERTQPDEPIFLPPAEVMRRLGSPAVAGAHLPGTLVFPEVVPDLDGIESVPLPPDEVEELLLANLYRAASAAREPTVLELLGGGRAPVPAELAKQLAHERPAHRVRLGARALTDAGLTRAIVDVAPCP